MNILSMTARDAETVWRLGKEEPHFKGFWPLATLEKLIASQSDITIVAKDESKIVGFSIAAFHPASAKVHWENMWVHPEYRKQGIGKKLTVSTVQSARTRKASFIAAIVLRTSLDPLLKHLGFQNEGNWYFRRP
jgi:ribosomal protein S18 acetylase RimI-like enzyme